LKNLKRAPHEKRGKRCPREREFFFWLRKKGELVGKKHRKDPCRSRSTAIYHYRKEKETREGDWSKRVYRSMCMGGV